MTTYTIAGTTNTGVMLDSGGSINNQGAARRRNHDLIRLRPAAAARSRCYRHEDGFAWTDGDLPLLRRSSPPFTLIVRTHPHPDIRYPIAPMLAEAA